jgi:gluconokinase
LSDRALAIILMGVSGCGKTSVGETLAQVLGWPFYDGDDFHSRENVAKMASGVPLNDEDRAPWLASLHDLISEHLARGESMLLACSALKQQYRHQLAEGNPGTVFVHLKGEFDLIYGRMQARPGHYMNPEMLRSQYEALEEPEEALTIEIDRSVEDLAKEIITQLDLNEESGSTKNPES